MKSMKQYNEITDTDLHINNATHGKKGTSNDLKYVNNKSVWL